MAAGCGGGIAEQRRCCGRRSPSPRACCLRSTAWRRPCPRVICVHGHKILIPFLTFKVKRLGSIDETACSGVRKSLSHTQTPVSKTRSIGVLVWMARPSPTSTCLHHRGHPTPSLLPTKKPWSKAWRHSVEIKTSLQNVTIVHKGGV